MNSIHCLGRLVSICRAPLCCFLALLSASVLFSVESAAQTRRVLLLGDSWAEYIWDGNNWQSPLAGYGLSQWSYEGDTTALGGSTASLWREPSLLNIISTALNSHPTIDIIHLSIGGNDMLAGQQLGGWHTGLSPTQESALFDQIQADIEIVVDHILSVRPNVKVGIVDYDYINLWEPSLAGIQGAQIMQLNLGNPSPSQVNTTFANMGLRKRAIANARDRVEYIHNWGLQQYYAGHPGFWDAGFVYRPPLGPGIFPFPGYPAAYVPYPGGSPLYPTPRSRLANNGDDGIHLSDSAYRQLVSNSLGQFFGGWLQDIQGPRVQSIVRLNPSPTVAQQLAFQVTFDEVVRTVTANDFHLTTSGGVAGPSIVSVTGSGTTRTVTVDRGAGAGTIRLDFVDNDTVYDLNWRPAGYDLTTNNDASFSTGQSYEILSDPPSVTIEPGTASPSLLNAVPFTITFDKAVTGFSSGDIQLNVSGPGAASVTGFNGSGTTYTFNLFAARSGLLTVDVLVPQDSAYDSANQGNLAGSFVGFQFDVISAAQNSPYLSSGALGALELSPGNSLNLFTGSGPNPPSYAINGGAPIAGELIDVGVGEIVAKFNFTEISLPAGVVISVTGDNPLAITGTQDIYWDAAISVSGAIAGRAGGGRGGLGGPGGLGGAGGSGSLTGGAGGPQVSGGVGGNNDNGGFGQPGAGRSNGSLGNSGSSAPNSAAPGGPGGGNTGASGFAGFGNQGNVGNGGSGGSPGVPGSIPNGGGIASASGGNGGSTDPIVPLPGAENGTPGQNANTVGSNGGNGTAGTPGGNGAPGDLGGNAQFTAAANNLSLAAGPGGGAGGGGGGAAGGQGGGKGGGGSSGAGGGGGGASCPFCVPNNIYCGARANAFGGAGGPGGAGGAGGNGGQGGAAPQASTGGDGGNGGGVIVIAARGLLVFNGSVDISASPPTNGGSAQGPVAGQPGADPGDNWSPVGLGGSLGAQGAWSWDAGFGCLSPLPMSGGAGGSGTRGGRGGAGGGGGPSGISGAGGNGGLGVPGMLKLHGSVVLANGGQVLCNNHTADTNPNLAGRFTVITNLANPDLPTFSDDIVTGSTRNDDVLRGPAPYDENLAIPLLPQLVGGVATSGVAQPGFWNAAQAASPGTDLVELVQLSGIDSPFADFDQIFLINTGGADAEQIILNIGGYAPFELASLPDGAIWTTTVPAATLVSLTLPLHVSAAAVNADLYVGDALSLGAEAAGGVPPYTFRWLRDGLEIQHGPNEAFTVANVSLADAGIYTVEVSDQLLDIVLSNEIEVLVDAPLSIQTQPQSATVPVGSNQTFNVAASGGKLPLGFDWQLNGLSLGAPSQAFLNINGVTPGDAGDYTVVIFDRLAIAPQGLATSEVAVLEVDDPLILSGPSSVTAYENASSVTFSVAVSGGVPPYRYEWRFGGNPLAPGDQPNSSTLTLNAPLSGKAGAYSVRVTDSDSPEGENLSAPALLTLVATLSITTQPGDLPVIPGGSGNFSVAINGGIPPIAYVWRKDGQPLAPGLQPNGPILNISNAGAGDEGDYDVIVSDSGDNTETSNLAQLAVAATPLAIVTEPLGARGYTTAPMALTSHSLSVTASGGLGGIDYLWLKDGLPAPGINNLPVYTLDPMKPADSGRYRCAVSDAVAPLLSDEVLVESAPRMSFASQPEGGQAGTGGSFTFSVDVDGGLGDLSYVWKRQAQNKADVIMGAGPVLELNGLESGDSGNYYCEVSDDFETHVSALALLEVTSALPLHGAWLLLSGAIILGMGVFLLLGGPQRRPMI